MRSSVNFSASGFRLWKIKPVKTGFIDYFGLAQSAPGILNVGTTDVDAFNPAKSVAHVFDRKNLANVSGDKPRFAFNHDGSNRRAVKVEFLDSFKLLLECHHSFISSP
jgi:hypothetical protein